MQKLWKDYNLSITLLILFLASWFGQFFFQMKEVADNAIEHGQVFEWAQFWPQFLSSTFENWQSEFLQLFSMVVLTAYLVHKGSHESKDSDEKVEAALARIEKKLESSSRKR